MDINLTYRYLLGRPWIHVACAVTSTLHQKLKFLVENKLIIIYGEEGVLVSHLSCFQYIKATEESWKLLLKALDIANVVVVGERDRA